MPTSPLWASIPVPTDDPKSLLETCLTMKRILEELTGQGNTEHCAPHVYVQADVPDGEHKGDLWLHTGANASFNIWNGHQWILVASVPVSAVADLDLARFRRPHR